MYFGWPVVRLYHFYKRSFQQIDLVSFSHCFEYSVNFRLLKTIKGYLGKIIKEWKRGTKRNINKFNLKIIHYIKNCWFYEPVQEDLPKLPSPVQCGTTIMMMSYAQYYRRTLYFRYWTYCNMLLCAPYVYDHRS